MIVVVHGFVSNWHGMDECRECGLSELHPVHQRYGAASWAWLDAFQQGQAPSWRGN